MLARAYGHDSATWRQMVRSLTGKLVDLFFPPVCASCGTEGELLCFRCREKIEWVTEPVCERCGRSLSTNRGLCLACSNEAIPLRQIRTATIYKGPVAETIKKFKYEGYFGLCQPLTELMLEAWPRWEVPVDLVVPVPLHTTRLRERGYNQSEMLARMLARELGWQMEPAALKRVRHTRPQVGLNSAERRANVHGAFLTEPSLIKDKHLLLVDDVRTTGSTLVAAAEVLLADGANSVSAFCLAGAEYGDDNSFNGNIV